ncbi:hypothetical protein DL89DRAFT_52140 [Linderina pennispora]|uniref:Uncharacterized protein n=1 Tax=Linderina pennispora TaxID=61395 RepID=A0A1Y1W0R4_9FUNG|nr:uncharacterized protein DL89DRAFT_52140 [Linderina pennispora]ORX67097.1 hypothetical protein DL89DRAFT_52140 [Linderina pennispora]
MVQKVSSRGSGAKKGGQKYQNTFAYSHNKGSKTTKKILSLPVDGLCQHCTDMVVWRKQYRKYKPLTAPKKCVSCELKKVKKAYHVICDDCAQKKGVCAKCLESNSIVDTHNPKTSEQVLKEEQDLERRLGNMRERERRSYMRKLERGDIQAEDVPDMGEEDSDFDFSDSEDEEDEE